MCATLISPVASASANIGASAMVLWRLTVSRASRRDNLASRVSVTSGSIGRNSDSSVSRRKRSAASVDSVRLILASRLMITSTRS